MRQFWGQGIEADESHANRSSSVRNALITAIARGEAGPPFDGTIGPWVRREGDPGTDDETAQEHPAGYIAGDDLVCALNTALLLGKPLLLTGNPGTGKSQLAERVAWEFNMGPVLRFESQSLSEAQDLYYRFDLVGRLAAVEAFKAEQAVANDGERRRARAELSVARFLGFGPLGKAILRATPKQLERLVALGLSPQGLQLPMEPRPSVVLIDEIDKTSRDFPNDLLNAIERKEFNVRELADGHVGVPDDEGLHPIVLITSNSERELPAPFLRRCIYFHIPDPSREMLAKILRSRVTGSGEGDPTRLHPLYADVLEMFSAFREGSAAKLAYQPGTSELLDLARALARSERVDPLAGLSASGNHAELRRAASTLIKHRDDRGELDKLLKRWAPT
ncbi:AAA family ATPase [Piscinibacter sp.]|uniref:AAA family ATPase n=1 Tax=Piscinibacter sp. TaxID=1903157 RepID=UPI002C00636F|nr:AAA family ATPase [Albitalea sp.]HUG22824.1 AAA family ATPase [Albitalea sp.]